MGAEGARPRGRRRLPDLAGVDDAAPGVVAAFTDRLRAEVEPWVERYLAQVREHVPGYAVLTDDEIRASARSVLGEEVAELASLRLPEEALRARLEVMALDRVGRGVSSEDLTLAYQIASRELLDVMDGIAAAVHLPADVLLAVHDSTWEFANEAAAVFARVQRDASVERARLDAERRSSFARAVLAGALPPERLAREAPLFGLDPRAPHVALAARASSPAAAEPVRRAIAAALGAAPDALVVADMGPSLGCVARAAPDDVPGHLVAVGPPVPLAALAASFDAALLALATAERFGMGGAVRLGDLGPKPLVLSADAVGGGLEERHLGPLARSGRVGAEVEETVRVLLDHDQQVEAAAAALTVHPNTVRYRLGRFRALSGLDVRRTDDLVTAWWLLNRRRAGPPA